MLFRRGIKKNGGLARLSGDSLRNHPHHPDHQRVHGNHRTRRGFYLLLQREAVVLIQHFERNIQEAMDFLQQLEEKPGTLC